MHRPVTDRDKPVDMGAADEDELERVAARVAGSQLRLALRGRAPEGWPPLPEESDPLTRIRYIVDVMRRGQWGGKRSVKALAATWGLTQSTIASDAVVALPVVHTRTAERRIRVARRIRWRRFADSVALRIGRSVRIRAGVAIQKWARRR